MKSLTVPELAAKRRRFGYRRLGYLLARESITPNRKELLRTYRGEGGQRPSPWRPASGTRHAQTRWRCPMVRTSVDRSTSTLTA